MNFIFQKLKAIKNIIKNRPMLVVFNITRLCNQHCLMCNVPQKSDNISLDKISKIAIKLKKFGISEIYLQGGEPLLRNDIIEIVDIFLSNSIRPTIITNGELLNENLIKEISKRNCNLSISIDSFIPELYAKLRGKDSLNKVLNNIELFSSIKHNGIFSLTSTITRYTTLDDLKTIQNYCEKRKLLYQVRPYNCNLDNAGAKSEELMCDNQKTIEILEYFYNCSKGKNILSSIIYKENINFLNGKKYNFCDALKYSMVLNEDGQISPCIEHTDIRFDFDNYDEECKRLKGLISSCNKNTPCIYGCTRNLGFLVKNKKEFLLNINKIRKYI